VCTGANPDGTVSGTELDTCTIYADTPLPIRTNDWMIVSPATPPPGSGIVPAGQPPPPVDYPLVTSCTGMTAVGSATYQIFAGLEEPGESPAAVSPPINGNACVFNVASGSVPNGMPLGTEVFRLPVTAAGTVIHQTALFCPPAGSNPPPAAAGPPGPTPSGFRSCTPPVNIPLGGAGAVVVDEIPPTISNMPAPMVMHAASAAGATATYAMPTVTDDAPGAWIACSPMSGSMFPVGTTTVTCTARDVAGLASTASFPVTIQVTFDGVRALVLQGVGDPAAAHSLTVKLDNAARAWARGDPQATAGMMTAFVNEVGAQSGKGLTPEAAAALAGLGTILETGPVLS
jgi:hypothetical protein